MKVRSIKTLYPTQSDPKIRKNKKKIQFQDTPLSQINSTHDSSHKHSNSNTSQPLRSRTRNINPLILQLHSRNKLLQRTLIDISIPAVLIKALVANIRNISVSPVKRARQNSTTNTVRPLRVESSVTLSGSFVAVCDNGVALGDVVRRVEGADVGVVDVGGVGQVDDERRDVFAGGEVAGVAAEEGRPGVQTKVLEGCD